MARELDLQLIFPPADLRRRIDDKLETTRIADSAGVSSVPNVLGSVQTYDDLRSLSKHLGPDLVVQTPYGDSGETTFFISSRDDFDLVQSHIAAEREVKIMKRIRPRQAAVEGCVTSSGTVVGPLSTEIVGFGELTPYKGGWAGNEIAAGAFSDAQRKQASHQTMLIGNAIQALGYRGYFEVDWLIDQDTDTLYLGELNPRLTGLSPLTNLAAQPRTQSQQPRQMTQHLRQPHDAEFADVGETLAAGSAHLRAGHTGELGFRTALTDRLYQGSGQIVPRLLASDDRDPERAISQRKMPRSLRSRKSTMQLR